MAKLVELFRKNIKYFLDERGWKQADLARAMKTSPQAVNTYFAEGTRPRIDSLEPIARAFGIEPYELIIDLGKQPLPRVILDSYKETINMQRSQLDRLIEEIKRIKSDPFFVAYEKASDPQKEAAFAVLTVNHKPK